VTTPFAKQFRAKLEPVLSRFGDEIVQEHPTFVWKLDVFTESRIYAVAANIVFAAKADLSTELVVVAINLRREPIEWTIDLTGRESVILDEVIGRSAEQQLNMARDPALAVDVVDGFLGRVRPLVTAELRIQ